MLTNEIFKSVILTATALTIAVISGGQSIQTVPPMESPRIVIKKNQRRLQIFDGEKLSKTYKIALGFAPDGGKQTEGDGKTPEGKFYVFVKNAKSKFYLSLGLSYPNVEAARRGLEDEIISREEHDAILEAIEQKKMPPPQTALGGEIYIHGGGIAADWTKGCVALRNEEMQEIYDASPVGAEVVIEE